MIEPKTLKGFRDYLPEVMIPRERMMEVARSVYRQYGFVPIDTPALEYLEILTGKGSDETERQLYRFEDHGGRQVGMRFDLTVPLARFVAQHHAQLGLPFKRYHIAPVWRGEAPQAGRFREFVQCDFDTIGTESVAADIETALVMHDLIVAVGVTEFKIHINHRQILTGLLEKLGLLEASVPVLRALDKLAKIGVEAVSTEMQQAAGLSSEQATEVLKLASVKGSNAEILKQLESIVAGNARGEAGLKRLTDMVAGLAAAGVPESRFELDVSIARGLDYYTGVVFETYLDALPEIGSICSGGRYDNLAGMYTKQHLPGIGASLGLDRLLAALEKLGKLPASKTTVPILVAYFDPNRLADYLKISRAIRSAGYGCELYPEPKKLGAQLKYADQKGFRIAVIAGSQELERGVVQLKDLQNKISSDVAWGDDPAELLRGLANMLQLNEGNLVV
jgi:histidyl-tRNA synthetase